METERKVRNGAFRLKPCPKGLSRWKGMETDIHAVRRCEVVHHVRKDFPVGREWKLMYNLKRRFILMQKPVRKDFPVGREWKPW